MTMTNHILTGATLAKFLPLPLAVPLAFASHFVLDSIPHFGMSIAMIKAHKRLWLAIMILDALVSIAVSIWLIRSGHLKWFLVGLVAYCPDLAWVYRFAVQEKFGKVEPQAMHGLTKFHDEIQKYERIWGASVELVYGLLLIAAVRY